MLVCYVLYVSSILLQSATVENIAALALDIKEATKKAVRDPAAKKPVKFAVSWCCL